MLRNLTFATVMSLAAICTACGGVSGSTSGSTTGGPASGSSSGSIAVQITPATTTVLQGETQQFSVSVTGTSNTGVTWSVQNDLGTITSSGLYTAPINASGTFQVRAVAKADSTKSATALVTVPGISVAVKPPSVTLREGGTQPFTAVVSGLRNTAVNWTVQEAGGGSVSHDGGYTAPDKTGIYHVIATAVARSDASGTATVTVPSSTSAFRRTGDMSSPRGFHTATLLPNGKVLVAGGANRAPDIICVGGIPSAELYDAVAGSFAKTGSMAVDRYAHTATLLPTGQVLITGGFGPGNDCSDLGEPATSTAELYDVSSGSFKSTGLMSLARGGHTATLLRNGKVLIAGGTDQGGAQFPDYGGPSTNSAELYDPATGKFTETGSMARARFGHTATLLANGTVLITGGVDVTNPNSPVAIQTSEIYDPNTGAFAVTNPMAEARAGHTATLLPNGRVLIAGGLPEHIDSGGILATAELYDPFTRTFSPTGTMSTVRSSHTATLLSDGTVLVAGGDVPTAEIYSPTTGTFVLTGGMEVARAGHTATLLQDGRVLFAGGGSYFPLSSAELFK